MSVDKNTLQKGFMFHERDKRRAASMFRQKAANLSFDDGANLQEDVILNRFEPDWTKFESTFARGNIIFLIVTCSLGFCSFG